MQFLRKIEIIFENALVCRNQWRGQFRFAIEKTRGKILATLSVFSTVENDNAEERIGKETADRFVSSGSHIVYCMFNPCAHGCSRLYGMRCRKLHGISVVYTVQNTYTVMITTQYSVFSS